MSACLCGCLGFIGDRALERVSGFDMSAGLTASLVAWPVSILPGFFCFRGTFSDGKRSSYVCV